MIASAFKTIRTCPLNIQPGVLAIAVLILIISCAHQQEPGNPWRSSNSAPRQNSDLTLSELQQQLEAEYQRWKGTRHRLGGSSRSGVDCSGFVQAVYKNIFEMDLPRTTQAQSKLGRSVKQNELHTGDLVFFTPPSYPRHVGIYLSRSKFIHASKTKGVTVSRISPDYWGKYFWTARRLLPEYPP